MPFAEDYLAKNAIRKALIEAHPDPKLACIVIIPAYNESRLSRCLDSLFLCSPSGVLTEVIVLINTSETADKTTIDLNQACYDEALEWKNTHHRKDLHFHIVYEKNLPKKHFGAGLARKIVMDEATRRFNSIDKPEGIIISLDADTTVAPNYIQAIKEHYELHPKTDGCSIEFRHPLEGDEFSPEVYKAILNYETYLHYYLAGLRATSYPYAYHTVGSAFSVKASVYSKQGGMSKRQAGEDFYFIQKIAMLGSYTECLTTTVYPSPRPSNRVPFGTGPEVQKQLDNPSASIKTYAWERFTDLSGFYSQAGKLYSEISAGTFMKLLPPLVKAYLEASNFEKDCREIRTNTSSKKAFMQRFYRKYNMFWILKFLHFTEEQGFEKVDLYDAVKPENLV